jgi:anti-sigma factor RsiW
MDCRLVQRHLSAYVDGELEPTAMLEVEEHLTGCNPCASEWRFLGSLKHELKHQLAPAPAPVYLRARVEQALLLVPTTALDEQPASHVWWTIVSVAASVMLVTGALVGTDRNSNAHELAALAAANPLDVMREVVARHKDQLPTEITTPVPEKATSWFRDKVSFRVPTVEFSEPRVHFEGARMSQVGSTQAAKLYYRVGDSLLTVVMFKASPSLEQVLSSDSDLEHAGMKLMRVSGREVAYRKLQGYTVPIMQDNGIVYAFTGDLDERMLLNLVATARFPH